MVTFFFYTNPATAVRCARSLKLYILKFYIIFLVIVNASTNNVKDHFNNAIYQGVILRHIASLRSQSQNCATFTTHVKLL